MSDCMKDVSTLAVGQGTILRRKSKLRTGDEGWIGLMQWLQKLCYLGW